MKKLLTLSLISILLTSFASCAHSTDGQRRPVRICDFSFDLSAGSFDLISKDDNSCSAFVRIGQTDGVEEVGSIVTSTDAPEAFLPRIPGNFHADSNGRISHTLPEVVSDDQSYYYVDKISPVKDGKFSLRDGSNIEIFEYRRTVTRLNEQGEESALEQACLDSIRYQMGMTILFTGCTDWSKRTFLYNGALKLLKESSSKLSKSGNPPTN